LKSKTKPGLSERRPEHLRVCKACNCPLDAAAHRLRRYCSDDCRKRPAPAVYRFVCPDGRSYIGSASNSRTRFTYGIARSNSRLVRAYEQYSPETWTCEVLERLPPGCSTRDLRKAEQRHIDRLRAWSPDAGFNLAPAIWEDNGPAQRAGRKFRAMVLSRWKAERQWR
jgi:hypothetical protein